MARADQIWDFLQRLTPLTRSCLLAELERLELCGVEMPRSADIQAKLRAEFRKDGPIQNKATPSRYFFAPLEPLLVDWRAPAAEPFYRATPGQPEGVVLRRHLLCLARGDGKLIWSRKEHGRFPEIKELKQIVRDEVAPERDLGHVDHKEH